MLEQFLGCAPFVALCLLPFTVLLFIPAMICKLPVGCFYRMDKNLNSTGRQTVKLTIRNNCNASMMSLFGVVVS